MGRLPLFLFSQSATPSRPPLNGAAGAFQAGRDIAPVRCNIAGTLLAVTDTEAMQEFSVIQQKGP